MGKRRGLSRNWQYVGLAGLAAVTLIASIGALNLHDASVAAPQDSAIGTPVQSPEPTGPTEVVIFGDSYTAAGEDAKGYALTLEERMGWDATILGQGGTGYTNPGQDGDAAYPDRVQKIIDAKPDLVILQGSTNDTEAAAVVEAAGSMLDTLQSELPKAEIVVVGPVSAPAVPEESLLASRSALALVTSERGIPFIDPASENWLNDPDLFVDGVHPSGEGYTELAKHLEQALEAKGF